MLNKHFSKHGAEFGYSIKKESLAGAQNFIHSDDPKIEIKYRSNGDTVYYSESTNEFVVVDENDIIRTYFKPTHGRYYFDNE